MMAGAPPMSGMSIVNESVPCFVSFDEKYVCAICHKALQSPVQTTCGHRMCSACLEQLCADQPEGQSIPCPAIEEGCDLLTLNKVVPDFCTQRELQQQRVYCKNKEFGCPAIVMWKELKDHLSDSCAVDVPCPFQCGHRCNNQKMKHHLPTCSAKPPEKTSEQESDMPDTGYATLYQTTSTNLKKELVGRDQGPSLPHGSNVQPTPEAASHEHYTGKANPEGQGSGQASKHGSQEEIGQKILLMERHLKSQHDCFAAIDQRLQALESASYDGTLVWKIQEYQKHRQAAILGKTLSLYSQPFYSSRYGYKVCARVYLNGDGKSEGRHLSLYFVVMKGVYDNILPWPMKPKVTLTLLAQNGNFKMNYSTKLKLPKGDKVYLQKPTTDMNNGIGCPDFSPISKVEEESYLVDDTIFIKIDVDTKGI